MMQVSNFAQPGNGLQAPLGNNTVVNGNAERLSSPVTPAPADDTLSITSGKVVIAQQLVTQQVEIALEIKSPALYSTKADDDQDDDDQLVDKVVRKIHDEKASNVDDVSDDEKHSAAVKSVRVKVAQGFDSATLALSRSGMMDNSVADNVAQTRSRVDAAIDQVAGQPVTAAASGTPPASVASISLDAVSAKRELSTSLQVTTRDGDVVTVNFNRSQAVTAGSVAGSEGTIAYIGSTSSSQLEISVQGDLSEKESKSIRDVVESINKLAEKLFSGKTGAAMEKLSELNINTEYLAGMSLNMSSSISYQAMSAYAQVSRLTDESAPAIQGSVQDEAIAPPAPSAVGNAADSQTGPAAPASAQAGAQTPIAESAGSSAVPVVQEAAKVVNEAVAADVFENPFNAIRDLFAQIADMFSFSQNDITDNKKDFVSELFRSIVDKVEANDEQDTDENVAVDNIAA